MQFTKMFIEHLINITGRDATKLHIAFVQRPSYEKEPSGDITTRCGRRERSSQPSEDNKLRMGIAPGIATVE